MSSPAQQRPVLTVTYANSHKDLVEQERRDALEMEIYSLSCQASDAEDEGDWTQADAMTAKAAALQTQLNGMKVGAA